MPNAILKGLNKEQKEAVIHKKGPLLIIAGAGTGKTTVLTRRVAYLIDKGFAKPDEILALTFTEKAAAEMEERVDELLPLGKIVQNISTFHSFCEKVLREEALEIGQNSSFEVLNTTSEWLLVFENIFKFDLDYFRPHSNPFKFIEAISLAISRLKDEGITPEIFEKRLNKNKDKITSAEEGKKLTELLNFYKKYEEVLKENSFIDFGGLILNTLELFKTRPHILKKYQKQFKYILVDEYQDTNFAQNLLVKVLAGDDKNITVAADDDQSIYRFRGASIENVLDFEKNFKGCKQIVLKENFRSCQEILDPAYKLIKQNNPDRLEEKAGITKKLIGKRGSGPSPQYFHFNDINEEAFFVTEKIEELFKKEKRPLEDFAILGRTNSDLDIFRNALMKKNIPFAVAASKGLFEERAVRDLISFLKIVADPEDSLHFFRFLNLEIFNLPEIDKIKIFNQAKKKHIPVYEVLKDKKALKNFTVRSRKALGNVIKIIEDNINIATKKITTEILVNFIKDSGYFKNLEKKNDQESMRNIFEFYKSVEAFERRSREKTIFDFIKNLELMEEAGESPPKPEILDAKGAVKLMTVHAGKGLEFNVVFLINLIKGRFPSPSRRDPIELPSFIFTEKLPIVNMNIHEERRLFYVGMTRACDLLFLSSSSFTETKTKKLPSPFIFEAGIAKRDQVLKKSAKKDFLFKKEAGFFQKDNNKKERPSFCFSYSKLDTFLICPLRYKYQYVYKIPTPSSYQLSFGNSIHKTLREFYKIFKKEKKVPPFRILKNLYQNLWEDSGYKSKKQEENRFKKGLETLEKHYGEIKEINKPPLYIEQKFRFRIGKNIFVGTIDRIDPSTDSTSLLQASLGAGPSTHSALPCRQAGRSGQAPQIQTFDKDNGNVNIIDYKTGSLRKKWEIEKIEKGPGLQASMYVLGAFYSLNKNIDSFIFDYLEHSRKLTTKRDKRTFKEIQKTLSELADKIKKSDFKATPGYQQCKYCDFKDICDYAYKI